MSSSVTRVPATRSAGKYDTASITGLPSSTKRRRRSHTPEVPSTPATVSGASPSTTSSTSTASSRSPTSASQTDRPAPHCSRDRRLIPRLRIGWNTLTNTPAPLRASASPSVCSTASACLAVIRATPCSAMRSFSPGNRSPGPYRPDSMSRLSPLAMR